ncbi:odorant receptor 49b-like [Uranotaenia lowii]|uniref:odorant receptor 49b-like n=1 Tax=Uranotaenia lowii TaxID=190385 RepID=UPI0024789816|nr:odorant receptor 49b-like [Uranotaenia lowii]
MMHSIIRLMGIMGLWSGNTPTSELAYIYRNSNDMKGTIRGLIEVVFLTRGGIQLFIIISYQELLKEVFYNIEATMDALRKDSSQAVYKQLMWLEKSPDLLFKWYFVAYVGAYVFYSVVPVLMTTAVYILSDSNPAFPVVIHVDYVFFDYRSNFWIWLAISISLMVINFSMTLDFVALDCFKFCLLQQTCGLFQIVRIKIQELHEFHDSAKFRTDILKILQLQEVAYRSSKKIEKALSTYIFVLYGLCIEILCMILLNLIIAFDDKTFILKMALTFNLIMFQIFSYSMLGTELETQSTSSARAIADLQWYDLLKNRGQSYAIQFMMMRSQKKAFLTAGGFFPVTRNSFMSALNMTYSFFTLMQQMYG